MPRTEDVENPYKPPATINQGVGRAVRSFQVGVDEINTVFVEASFLTGLKTHSIDAAGISGPVYRGVCRFEVGETERHQVMIETDGMARVNAYVDGELVEANLFARLRAFIFFSVTVFSVSVFVVALVVTAMVFNA
jgi:hypothetical protein